MHLRSVRPTSSRREENLDAADLDFTIVSSLLLFDMKCRVFVFVVLKAAVLVLVERRRRGV